MNLGDTLLKTLMAKSSKALGIIWVYSILTILQSKIPNRFYVSIT